MEFQRRKIFIYLALVSSLAVMIYAGTRTAPLTPEARTVREACAYDFTMSRNYLCGCIAEQFMMLRKFEQQMGKDELLHKVLRDKGAACLNRPALREAAMLACRDLRAQTYRDLDCQCVAREAVKQAQTQAHPLTRFTPMPKAAQNACSI